MVRAEACVALPAPCLEWMPSGCHWAALAQPKPALIVYGYVGLVIVISLYYYLYCGNWVIIFSRGLIAE